MRKRFEVEIPEGQHLGVSGASGDAVRGHLFDDETNKLVGHAELFEVDDDWHDVEGRAGSEPGAAESGNLAGALLAALVTLAVAKGVEAGAPIARRWIVSKATPRVERAGRSMRRQVGRIRRRRPVDAVEVDTRAPELELALADYQRQMSSEEARRRLIAALSARNFYEEQMALLRSSSGLSDEELAQFEALPDSDRLRILEEALVSISERIAAPLASRDVEALQRALVEASRSSDRAIGQSAHDVDDGGRLGE